MTEQIDALIKIIADSDRRLRKRLQSIGPELPHLLVVLAPSGVPLVRGNMDPAALRALAQHLDDLAAEGLSESDNNEHPN